MGDRESLCSMSFACANHIYFILTSQIYNGLGLLLVSMHPRFAGHRFAGPAILAGSIAFSGSIFGLVLGGDSAKFLGPVTPLGGLTFMAGYALHPNS